VDRAGAIFRRLKDVGSRAQVDETRARVFIDEKKYGEADRVIVRAVQTLEAGGAGRTALRGADDAGPGVGQAGKNDVSIRANAQSHAGGGGGRGVVRCRPRGADAD
jgi:hypothetical protein